MKNLPRPILRALTLATLILGLFAVYIALILLNNEFSSNIVFAQTMLDDLSEWAYLLIELLAIVTSYTFFLFSLAFLGRSTRRCRDAYLLCCGNRASSRRPFMAWLWRALVRVRQSGA